MKDNLEKQYEMRFGAIHEYREKVWAILVDSFFQKLIPEGSTILEMGCGWGEFINRVRGKRKIGIDLNPTVKAKLASNIEFLNQDCSADWPIEDDSLDVIFTSNLLEHLPSKSHIEKTVSEARRCLAPGGRLICMGANVRFVQGEYWDFWDHQVVISDRSLNELLRMNDFAIEKCLDRFLPFSMVNRQPPLILLRIYLALPIAWRFFGKQFLIVAQNDPANRRIADKTALPVIVSQTCV